ncbi:double zinc ribbon domain-containing protein, partial [Escherichia coli]|uniref:double zinc ribbon domain-containing protein n=1 Tax=Escherichia coli TaxID=562 RepID=UPI0034D6158E
MKWSKFFLNFLFPENCKICQKFLHYNEALICTDCFLKLPFLKFYCSKCGNPFDEMLENFSIGYK